MRAWICRLVGHRSLVVKTIENWNAVYVRTTLFCERCGTSRTINVADHS
jgi:hypothetical protein